MTTVMDVRLRYQTLEFGETDIHVCTLRDNQEFSDPQGIAAALGICSASWPLFGIIWPSSLVLAHHMSGYDIAGKRILEVGCGMALSSLLLNHRQADITATDYHPAVQYFLDKNAELNEDKQITFERLDWSQHKGSLGLFDTIIGSDLLYEDQHVAILADFIGRHAKPICEVIIVDPGRGRKNKIVAKMEALGFSSEQQKPIDTVYLDQPFKGHLLTFLRQ